MFTTKKILFADKRRNLAKLLRYSTEDHVKVFSSPLTLPTNHSAKRAKLWLRIMWTQAPCLPAVDLLREISICKWCGMCSPQRYAAFGTCSKGDSFRTPASYGSLCKHAKLCCRNAASRVGKCRWKWQRMKRIRCYCRETYREAFVWLVWWMRVLWFGLRLQLDTGERKMEWIVPIEKMVEREV